MIKKFDLVWFWRFPSNCFRLFSITVIFFFCLYHAACNFDFEDGIGGWETTGTAFIYQPTFGDNPIARGRESAKLQGDWWVGGAENRPRKSSPPGGQHPDGSDPPRGTLTSPCFRIVGKDISFLIGGGCNVSVIRVELIVNNQVSTIRLCRISSFHLFWLCFLRFVVAVFLTIGLRHSLQTL